MPRTSLATMLAARASYTFSWSSNSTTDLSLFALCAESVALRRGGRRALIHTNREWGRLTGKASSGNSSSSARSSGDVRRCARRRGQGRVWSTRQRQQRTASFGQPPSQELRCALVRSAAA